MRAADGRVIFEGVTDRAAHRPAAGRPAWSAPVTKPPPRPAFDGVPRRFWTAALARLALAQGEYHLALQVVAALEPTADEGQRSALRGIRADAERGLHEAARQRQRKARVDQLEVWLRRARQRRRLASGRP